MFDQNPKDPFMLDCLICEKHAATLISPEGVFHCANCSPTETPFNPDDYCVSCGVDSRAKGRDMCTWCYESMFGEYASRTNHAYMGGAGAWAEEDDEQYKWVTVEDDVELIKAVR